MIYLLHIDPPVGRAAHYLGCTGENTLQLRLHRHATGQGAALIREAIKRGSKLYLARTFPGVSFDIERQIKSNGHFKKLCPICCPVIRPEDLTPYEITVARPPWETVFTIWGWPDRQQQTA